LNERQWGIVVEIRYVISGGNVLVESGVMVGIISFSIHYILSNAGDSRSNFEVQKA